MRLSCSTGSAVTMRCVRTSSMWWTIAGMMVTMLCCYTQAMDDLSSSNQTFFNGSLTEEYQTQYPCFLSNLTFDLDDICDGQNQCPYLDDEFFCGSQNCSQFNRLPCSRLASDRCIHLTYICDGFNHCWNDDNIDESWCDSINCSSACECSQIRTSCNGAFSIEKEYLSPTTRILEFQGEQKNDVQYPETMPFSLTNLPLLLYLSVQRTGLRRILLQDWGNVTTLTELILSGNLINEIEPLSFSGMTELTILDLSDNYIESLSKDTFTGLVKLHELNLSENLITRITSGVFNIMSLLTELDLSKTTLSYIEEGSFEGLGSVLHLFLYQTNITSLHAGGFVGLDKLISLHIFEANISHIAVNAFEGLDHLEHLDLTDNLLEELSRGVLSGLPALSWISLSYNPLKYVEPWAFENLPSLRYLNLVDVELEKLQPDTFSGLTALDGLSTDDYRLCCLFNDANLCTVASSSFLDSCTRLMPNTVLRVALWIIGCGALIGNVTAIGIRCQKDRSNSARTQGLFITNLAVADFLMGVYMLIIASADMYYGEFYYLYAHSWRESHLCKFAGLIAVLSSEASVFVLAIITVDRFLCIVFPFGKVKFHATSARIGVAFVWILAFGFSVCPLIVTRYVSGFYGQSDVCVGLPINVETIGSGELEFSVDKRVFEFVPADQQKQSSWIFSIFLFLGLNFAIFILICVSYMVILFSVIKSSRTFNTGVGTAERTREVKMALRMAIIVLTDFFCWMPVILMGIISQSGAVVLPVTLYAWSVVFILPINASINPYIYTFMAMHARRQKSRKSFSESRSTIVMDTISKNNI